MRSQVVHFNKSMRVFQVFKNINFYTKQEKSFDDRKEGVEWTETQSKSGYVKDGDLFLNEQVLEDPDFLNCNLLTIIDKKETNLYYDHRYHPSVGRDQEKYNTFHQFTHTLKIDDFEIRKAEGLELHLCKSNSLLKPSRPAFKLCDISENEPVEVKLNYKSDTTMSRGMHRMFVEKQYIFNYLGQFSQCHILKQPFDGVRKEILCNAKLIDLFKPLW